MILAGLAISLYNGWVLTLVMLAYFPLLIIVYAKAVSVRHKMIKEYDEVYQESDIKAQESLSAIKLVKQMNAEEF